MTTTEGPGATSETADAAATSVRPDLVELLTLYERLRAELQHIADSLKAPEAQDMAREVRRRTGDPGGTLAGALSAVEEAIRTLNVSGSEVRLALASAGEPPDLDGVPRLPPTLRRFLSERRRRPGFRFEVTQDEVRGWVIKWKEQTEDGAVRGAGQFYERPYAWLED